MRAVAAGLAILVGCARNEPENTDCNVEVAPDVHTVLKASWTSSAPGKSWVEYELDGETQRTPVVDDGGTAHTAVLLGLRYLNNIDWTLITGEGDAQSRCSGTTQTENVIPETIGLTVDHYDPGLVGPERYIFGSAYGRYPRSTVYVVNKEDGSFRWYAQGDEHAQIVTAAMAVGADGSQVLANGVLYNQFDMDHGLDIGAIVARSAVGEVTANVRTPLSHHAFTQLPDGTLTWLSLDTREWTDPDDGVVYQVAGDSIWELGADGVPKQIFSVYDWVDVAPNAYWAQSLYPGFMDWSHADGIRWNEGLDAYVVPFAHLEQVWLIGRDGVPRLRLGKDTPIPVEEGVHWELPHDAQILDDGSLLVFLVNENLPGSGCHQFTIGPDALTETWHYDAKVIGRFLGKCSRMPGGNTLVGFGSGGQVHEVTPDGTLAWGAHVTDVAGLGTAMMFEDLYPRAD